MKYTLNNANNYIQLNKNKVNEQYKLKFHMMPPVGWMNDPNGLVKFEDNYHLFYQYYPYESKWGPMHWGHFVSKDLISYEDVDVALAPTNQEVESGCWSGGAFVKDDTLNLIYTRHYELNDFKSQQQCIATSTDGLQFTKREKPLFNNDELPENISKSDFRDPFVFYKNGYYYMLVGGKLNTDEGIIVVLKSMKLDDFKFDFIIGPYYELGNMGECPAYHNVDGMDIIVASGCAVKQKGNNYKNCNSSVYLAGKLDLENKKFDIVKIEEIDKGDTYYAPQFISNNDEPIMIGWMEMWGKEYPTAKMNHNWIGALSIPRKLSWKNNTLYQEPIDSIKGYYKNTYKYEEGKIKSISDITISAKDYFSIKFNGDNGCFEIGNNEHGVYLDTTGSNNLNETLRHTNDNYKEVKVRVLLDKSSVEMFINDGVETITSRVYIDGDYSLDLSNREIDITINEIEV